jgi:hypothetical protein
MMIIIKRILKGTSFEVTVELNEVQYAHFQLVTGQIPGLHISLDQNLAGEMAALAAHFRRRPEPLKMATLHLEDEVWDAMKMVR